MTYRAVVFDLFGTLVPSMRDSDYFQSLRETAAAVGAEPDEFCRLWVRRDLVELRSNGTFADQAEFIEHLCGIMGVAAERDAVRKAAQCRAEFDRMLLVPRQDALDVLSRLKRARLKLCLMSVASRDAPGIWPSLPLAPLFDAALFSCEVGLIKPDPRFYALACEAVAAGPHECMYVGDGAGDELTGARNAGMHPVLICPPDEEDVILSREQCRNWRGAKVQSLSELPALLGLAEQAPR